MFRWRALLPTPDRYFRGDQRPGVLLSAEEAEQDGDIAAVHEFFQGLQGLCAEDAEDISVRDLMQRRGHSARQLALADSQLRPGRLPCSRHVLGTCRGPCWGPFRKAL